MTFELQGHRGARGLFAENTLAGFAATLALGVDAIELDVAVTADGVPVVFHDVALSPDLARGPDGAWLEGPGPLIHALSAAEVARYDVGRARPGGSVARGFPGRWQRMARASRRSRRCSRWSGRRACGSMPS